MAGNSRRRGATRTPGSKKGARVGTGGHGRQSLEGRGPTPKAEDREYHPAAKKKAAATRKAEVQEKAAPKRAPKSRTQGDSTEIIAGRNAVLEALRAGVPVQTAWFAHRIEADERTREIIVLASESGAPMLEASKSDLDKITFGASHQGVAIQVPPYDYADPEDLLDAAAAADQPALIVALDGVTDPRNLGAALRSAGAFGAHGVLVPERRSAGVTAAAWKVSAGSAARVPVARATNLVRALEEYRKAGVFVVGLAADGDTPLDALPFATDPLVVVVGSEGKGLSRLVTEKCDAIVSIPIASAVESLNAGVATGIALYEVARQRG
ncbi:MAG: 23S rRNA (guanosine(2251)-2'-O)-methyltransferase RlmB [Actinomycetota bacterium]|nr:23S rRNA (guanosine(2251)-2'-O)-methyltransferase RlmB [Actinomycetota bacterium]